MTAVRVEPLPNDVPLVELAAALDPSRWPLLLDSGPEPHALARWHLLVFDPLERVVVEPDAPGTGLERVEAALARRWPGARRVDDPALPPFVGGAAGLLGYDLARRLERLPRRARPDAPLPDLACGIYPFVVAEEAATGRRLLAGRLDRDALAAARSAVEAAAERAAPLPPPPPVRAAPASTFSRSGFVAAVERVREHILDGDVYQVNLSQRFLVPWDGRSASLHAALRRRFPAPYASLLRTERFALVSSSPELFLRRRGTRVESRPIKGTRPRGADPDGDRALRAELEASPKERAELAMIVDLVRNDLGRTAEVGSVVVEDAALTDSWSTVHHRVATVASRVPAGMPARTIVEAAFPPASVTGTPKIRATEVIETLEPVRRHAYTGALGWIGPDGDLELSVNIRIATLVQGRLLIPVGGGITLDSEPEAEYEETLHKARALFEVLSLAAPAESAP